MNYRTEKELQIELANLDLGLFSQYPVYFTRREVRVAECIPDLVSVHFDRDPKDVAWPKRWNYQYSFTIAMLKVRGELGAADIAELSFSNVESVMVMLQNLLKWNLIQEHRLGEYSLSAPFLEMNPKVVSVEAKLRDWRSALSQAKRYAQFSDLAFVAMDADEAPVRSGIIDAFDAGKIGLCAVSPGMYRWILQPRPLHVGHTDEQQHIIMSAVLPSSQTAWTRRNLQNASSHALA
jgi:hypothetical protein